MKNLTLQEIDNMTVQQAVTRGMRSLDGNLYLIPLSDYSNWPDGVELTSICGDKKVKGKDYIDEDTRGGLLAYGIYPKKLVQMKLEEFQEKYCKLCGTQRCDGHTQEYLNECHYYKELNYKELNAKDLQIEDWVQMVSDAPTMANECHRIDWIRTGELGLDNRKIVTYPYIQPIPLTEEILKKNFPNPSDGLIWFPEEGGFNCHTYVSNCEINAFGLFKYVHELQHALRLCGIEKEIVL